MAAISAKDVKALRDRTGAAMMACRNALTEAEGDIDKAIELLRARGRPRRPSAPARRRRGHVQSYIHANSKIGVLVEVDCETDFVARNEDFVAFARDVALHIAAATPLGRHRGGRPGGGSRARGADRDRAGGRPAGERPRADRRRASSTSGSTRSCCCARSTSTRTSTAARRSRSCAPSSRPRRGENIVIRRFARFVGRRLSRRVTPVRRRPGLSARPAEAVGRGADGRARVRHRSRAGAARSPREIAAVHRRGVEVAIVVGGGNIYRGLARRGARDGPRDRRLHGHAGDGAERARAPGRAREAGRRDAGAVGDHDLGGRRAVHPPPRDAPPREGPDRDLRGRHRQPVLHDRHGRGAAGRRAARRGRS